MYRRTTLTSLRSRSSFLPPDEELTVSEFVEWCKQGLEQAGIVGEIVIVDSSSDRTRDIALEHGARVLSMPRRGLGRA